MYAATSPSNVALDLGAQTLLPSGDGMQGRVKLVFGLSAGETRLKDLYQAAPMRVLFPSKATGDILSAALVTISGGLKGGDRMDVEVTVNAAAAVQIIGQAAEKVYRSNGSDTIFEARLDVAEDAWCEWLPQETIVFDKARLRRLTHVDVASGATFLGAEILVFGRTAMGETLDTGLVRDVWDVRRAGKRVWADALYLSGDIKTQLDNPAGFDGARAAATSILVADNADQYLDFVRNVLDEAPEGVKCAATHVNGILVTRWLAFDAQALRDAFAVYWSAMRHELKGLPAVMPRLWQM